MPHRGGVRKVPKKCHVFFEWPLKLTFLTIISINNFDNRLVNKLRNFEFDSYNNSNTGNAAAGVNLT